VLGVTAVADNLSLAVTSAYRKLESVRFSNAYFRSDIGSRALAAKK
jgi:phosphoribosylamine-glycine ligase